MTVDKEIVTDMEEKPMCCLSVNLAIYVIEPRLIAEMVRGERLDMPDLVEGNLPKLSSPAYSLREMWIDLGRPDDLHKAEKSYQPERLL